MGNDCWGTLNTFGFPIFEYILHIFSEGHYFNNFYQNLHNSYYLFAKSSLLATNVQNYYFLPYFYFVLESKNFIESYQMITVNASETKETSK